MPSVAVVPLGDSLIVMRHDGTRATAVLVLLSAALLFVS